MNELFLIAHKVRGAATFDVAEKMECPLCEAGCVECDGMRFWWIVGTSGHRAYPWRWWPLANMQYVSLAEVQEWDNVVQPMVEIQNGIPEDWPDHFTPLRPQKINIKALFKSEPKQHIQRRL